MPAMDRWHPSLMDPPLNDLIAWRYAATERRDVVVIPTVWVAAFLSLLFHVAMFWFWLPRIPNLSTKEVEPGATGTVLVTRLAPEPAPIVVAPPPPPPPLPSSPPRTPTRPIRPVRPPAATDRAPSAPTPTSPEAALGSRSVEPVLEAPAPPAAAAPPPRQASETDLASYIAARRRERGDPATVASIDVQSNTPPSETETERLNRAVAASLAPTQPATFGYDPKTGGGIFQIVRVGYDDAEFYFTGWDKEIRRRAKQLIEVRKEKNGDIREAIVRKMIAIIRDEVQGEFTWESVRLGRRLVMSARPRDNAELEAFLMEEFFSDPRSLH
jgi:hypothetical protein